MWEHVIGVERRVSIKAVYNSNVDEAGFRSRFTGNAIWSMPATATDGASKLECNLMALVRHPECVGQIQPAGTAPTALYVQL